MNPPELEDRRSLDTKFAGGLAWTAGAKWATQGLTWASVLLIARLLPPSQVGIYEIGGIFAGLANVLAEFGIGTAVLHMPELQRRALAQLNSFSLILSSGICLSAFVAAPAVAWFFHSEHVLYFALTGLGFLLTGLQAVPYGLLQRDMDYRRLAILEALGATAQAIISVVVAWLGGGYWSLYAGTLSSRALVAALICSWKPLPLAWPHWAEIRRPVEMGRQLAVSRLAAAAYTNADGIVVGRTLGEASLGIYRMAINLASAPAEKISSLIMRAASPLFANVMDDLPMVRRYYLIIVELLSLAVMPLMIGLSIVAKPAVQVLMDKEWIGSAGPLMWLALFMIVRVLGVLAEQVLVSQRLTRFTMRMSILNFVLMPLAFYVAARWKGLDGVASAWIALTPITIMPVLIRVLPSIRLSWREYVAALLPAVAGSAAMFLAVLAFESTMLPGKWPVVARLAAEILVGGGAYFVVIFCFFRGRVLRYVRFLLSLRTSKGSPEAVAP